MAAATTTSSYAVSPAQYKRRIWAWTMYDWANSAFATTILAAVLPVYFSQVAGATLPSATVATSYWSFGLSISLFIIAIFSPVLGTISDIMRGKKRFLALFAGLGIISTALLVLVGTGDWILASILGILGRIGFNGANTFYDALLPHVAREEDRDSVSARGYAMGYLGGGLLLAINIVMIQLLPGTWGARLSFLSVAIWWAVFTIPLLRQVPEPPAAAASTNSGNIISASFKRLGATIADIRRYRELFKFLIAFLIYNDGIGTIIGLAAIYGAELGFGAVEMILALLMVQFVAIPYSLIFGRLPGQTEKRRPFFLAFIVLNMLALPLTGILASRLMAPDLIGSRPAPYAATATAVGEGLYPVTHTGVQCSGDWQTRSVPATEWGGSEEATLMTSTAPEAACELRFNGQTVDLTYTQGPANGIWLIYMDGAPHTDPDTLRPAEINAYRASTRYAESVSFSAEQPGEHILRIENSGRADPAANLNGAPAAIELQSLRVKPPARSSNLGLVIGMVLALEALLLLLAFLLGPALFSSLALRFDARNSILLGLAAYSIIAVWGYFIDSVVEFWFLAWLVAVVQGGSQALSRSLYAAMSPAAKSGEFFGLFGIMEKFSAIIGPLLFLAAGVLFGSSRPAVLSLVLIFLIGGFLLTRVDIDEGKRVAREEDAEYLNTAPGL